MSLATPIAPQSLVDQAFERMVGAIVGGEFPPGERIGEVRVARQLGISRGPLREALVRLEGRRLVERRPNVGMFVITRSQADFDELFALREALEGMACRLAAEHMTDAELDRLEALLKRRADGSGHYQTDDEDLHFLIVRGSRNSRLITTLCDDLYYQVRFYRHRSSTRPGRTRSANAEHRAIVDALKARDADRAEAAMRKHISNARANLLWMDDAKMSEDT